MKNKVVIFDFDGVILDSLQITYELSKKAVPFLSFRMFSYTYKSRFVLWVLLIVKRIISSRASRNLYKQTYSTDKLERSVLYAGVKEMLENVSRKYTITLNTNSYAEDSLPILKQQKIESFFTIVKTSSISRSKQEKTTQILEETNQTPNNAIFVTDTIADVESAKASQVKVIAVTWGIHKREDFVGSSARDAIFAIVDSPQDLEKAIDTYFHNEAE